MRNACRNAFLLLYRVLVCNLCCFPFHQQVDGVRRATPLLLVLACIELSDVVFAVDSIPAVFAVTKVNFCQRRGLSTVRARCYKKNRAKKNRLRFT